MSRKAYIAQRQGPLLFVRAAFGGSLSQDRAEIKLLVDTGSVFTSVPVAISTKLGYFPYLAPSIVVAGINGSIKVPVVQVHGFSCLGQRLDDFKVMAHDLPQLPFDGLLGLDFLYRTKTDIKVFKGILLRSLLWG